MKGSATDNIMGTLHYFKTTHKVFKLFKKKLCCRVWMPHAIHFKDGTDLYSKMGQNACEQAVALVLHLHLSAVGCKVRHITFITIWHTYQIVWENCLNRDRGNCSARREKFRHKFRLKKPSLRHFMLQKSPLQNSTSVSYIEWCI